MPTVLPSKSLPLVVVESLAMQSPANGVLLSYTAPEAITSSGSPRRLRIDGRQQTRLAEFIRSRDHRRGHRGAAARTDDLHVEPFAFEQPRFLGVKKRRQIIGEHARRRESS